MTQTRRSQLWATWQSAMCHGTASSCPGPLTVEPSRPFCSQFLTQRQDLPGKTTQFLVTLRASSSQTSSQRPGTGSVCTGCTEEPCQTPFLPTPLQVQSAKLGSNLHVVSSLLFCLSVSPGTEIKTASFKRLFQCYLISVHFLYLTAKSTFTIILITVL